MRSVKLVAGATLAVTALLGPVTTPAQAATAATGFTYHSSWWDQETCERVGQIGEDAGSWMDYFCVEIPLTEWQLWVGP
ncbi:hypothetical protein ACIBHY_28460 [Nonomuraea sp. NPDC050547]|uniref:hypothetical protein n=1 Tax=unclassified Nonomuraea TaxID=2593643 RepID=UPI0037ADB337